MWYDGVTLYVFRKWSIFLCEALSIYVRVYSADNVMEKGSYGSVAITA
jgi:hypothetical protein